MQLDRNEVPEIISKFLQKVSVRSDLVDDTDIDVSSISKEVEQNLRANRKRKNLNCPEFTRNDGFVGIRFPGNNYNEYRARQLKELTEHLRTQRCLMESEPRKVVIESKTKNLQQNWRKEDRQISTSNTADDVNLNKIHNPVRNQSCSTTKNWRTECKSLVPTKNKNKDKCEDHHSTNSFSSNLAFKK